MPGKPLPDITINLEDRGWPYDDQLPEGERWGEIPVTPQAQAVFDAQDGLNPSGLTRGIVKIIDQPSNENRINAEIPNTGGQRGYLFDYAATAPDVNINGRELNYELLIPQREVWDYIRLYQPDNLYFRREWRLYIDDFSEVSSWEVGDEITNGAGWWDGILNAVNDEGDGSGNIVVNYVSGGYSNLIFPDGSTVTNRTKSASSTVASRSTDGSNGKFMSLWLDNSYGEAAHGGYSNGGMFYGLNPAPREVSTNAGNGYNYVTAQTNSYKVGPEDGNNDGGKPANGAQYGNELYTGDNDNRYDSQLFDVADNGHFVNFVFERRRNTTETSNDASYRIWKKVERTGSPHEQWTLIWETTNVGVWSPHQDNKFTHGYHFGNSNAGYAEDTNFYINRWELWTQKPTFLTEAGV